MSQSKSWDHHAGFVDAYQARPGSGAANTVTRLSHLQRRRHRHRERCRSSGQELAQHEGQVLGSEQGIFLATNPHSSFFYLLTGLHGVHLLGGLVWFGVLFARARGLGLTPGTDSLSLFATYWHFLAGLWLYLLLLLFVL
jgi:hypothetical protein